MSNNNVLTYKICFDKWNWYNSNENKINEIIIIIKSQGFCPENCILGFHIIHPLLNESKIQTLSRYKTKEGKKLEKEIQNKTK